MSEIIEIPFGAKDSELGGWEYTIPEGFVASIENGKIVVKKEENEDERAKKEITELVMQPTWKTEKEFHRRKELCVWLEKQGESKFEQCIQEGDKIVTNEDGTCFNVSQLERIAKKEPKFKVGDIIRHKKQGFTCKIIAVDTEYRLSECNGTHLPFEFQDFYELVEQKPAWSEDDEMGLEDALWAMKIAAKMAKDENDMGNIWYAEKWLKSLKERMKGE